MKKLVNPNTGKETLLPENAAHARSPKSAKKNESKKCRDINEDDDGYHPYSDRQEHCPMYEEDPWR